MMMIFLKNCTSWILQALLWGHSLRGVIFLKNVTSWILQALLWGHSLWGFIFLENVTLGIDIFYGQILENVYSKLTPPLGGGIMGPRLRPCRRPLCQLNAYWLTGLACWLAGWLAGLKTGISFFHVVLMVEGSFLIALGIFSGCFWVPVAPRHRLACFVNPL